MLEHYYQKVATPPPPPAPREPGDPAQFCKYAATLELCGWIEEAQDYIVLQCGGSLSETNFKKSLTGFVRKNYGFDMDEDFLPMMAYGIGVLNYEVIVKAFGAAGGSFSRMVVLLGTVDYRKLRNRHAHTHFDEAVADKLQHLNSPAVVKQHAVIIFNGFEELFNKLKADRYL